MTIKERDALLIRLDERMNAMLEEVKKTNGRVTSLEGWKNRAVGALLAATTIGTVLGALAGYMINYFTT